MLVWVKLNIPPFVRNHTQSVVQTCQIASLMIHVERAIRRIKRYRILGAVMPLTYG